MSNTLALFSRLSDWQNILDIALVTFVFYMVLRLLQGAQAVQLLRGILIIGVILAVITRIVDLTAFGWLLRNSSVVVLVAIPVIFQPELRRALERLGRTLPFLGRRGSGAATQLMINEIAKASEELADRRHGALIVLEGSADLGEFMEQGVPIDGAITAELLRTLFYPNTALHDGAVIVRQGRVAAAGCVLPLTRRELPDSQLGTRHRAGIGITEQTDTICIIISEETGVVSVARNGRMVRRVDSNRLRRIMSEFYAPEDLPVGQDIVPIDDNDEAEEHADILVSS